MQLIASFTLGEGRDGFSIGAHNLGMTSEAPSGETPEEVRGLIEALKSRGTMADETLLQLLVEEGANVLKCSDSSKNAE